MMLSLYALLTLFIVIGFLFIKFGFYETFVILNEELVNLVEEIKSFFSKN